MHLQGQRTRSTRRSNARPGVRGNSDIGGRGLDTRADRKSGGQQYADRTPLKVVAAKMEQSSRVGTPDARKRACPVWGGLGGIPLLEGSKDAVLLLHHMRCPYCHRKNVEAQRIYTIQCGAPRTLYHCAPCARTFSETRHTPLAHLKRPLPSWCKSWQLSQKG